MSTDRSMHNGAVVHTDNTTVLSCEKRMKLCICSSIVDLEDIVLTEISKTEKDTYCMLSPVESKK